MNLQMLAKGQSTKVIATTLEVSHKTVAYHRARLMEVLKIIDLAGLVRFALRTGLFSQES